MCAYEQEFERTMIILNMTQIRPKNLFNPYCVLLFLYKNLEKDKIK